MLLLSLDPAYFIYLANFFFFEFCLTWMRTPEEGQPDSYYSLCQNAADCWKGRPWVVHPGIRWPHFLTLGRQECASLWIQSKICLQTETSSQQDTRSSNMVERWTSRKLQSRKYDRVLPYSNPLYQRRGSQLQSPLWEEDRDKEAWRTSSKAKGRWSEKFSILSKNM